MLTLKCTKITKYYSSLLFIHLSKWSPYREVVPKIIHNTHIIINKPIQLLLIQLLK